MVEKKVEPSKAEKKKIIRQYEIVREELIYLFNLAYIHDRQACRRMLTATTNKLDDFVEDLNLE